MVADLEAIIAATEAQLDAAKSDFQRQGDQLAVALRHLKERDALLDEAVELLAWGTPSKVRAFLARLNRDR